MNIETAIKELTRVSRDTIVLVDKLRKLGIRDNDIPKILQAISEVCHECWDTDTTKHRCTCMMDW